MATLSLAALIACYGCSQQSPEGVGSSGETSQNAPRESAEQSTADSGGLFVDVTRELGIQPPDGAWPDGAYLVPEITAGGVAVLDYDGDGRLDLYQTNHCAAGSLTAPAPNRLFRQEEGGAFKEVPDAAGLDDPGYGHGVAVGDIDNDGDVDVFVANYGANAIYVNEGGDFVNHTSKSGISGDAWSSSAGFFDYDRDGDLDLWVVNFAVYDRDRKCFAGTSTEAPDYCGPHMFDGLTDTLYRNNGDGTFTDVSEEAGVTLPGRGWGLVCADLTGDGWPDVYVANDEEPAQLWVNQRDGSFEEEAVFRGCAYNMAGRVEAGMGVAIADVDRDGRLDLFKTHIGGETNTLYLSQNSDELYDDTTPQSSMGAVDRPYTGWGCGFFDYDHDGALDVAIANGRVNKGVAQPDSPLGAFWGRLAEPNLLFRGDSGGRFTNVSKDAGNFGSEPLCSRGMAMADLDADGDLDLAVQHLNNELRVYRNDAPRPGSHWLTVRAMTGRRDAYGARVTLQADDKKWLRLAHPTSSFLSSNDPRAHFGLGAVDSLDQLMVEWPSGRREWFSPPEPDQAITVVEGEGQAVED